MAAVNMTMWQERARACLPGLQASGEVLHRTDKAVLLGGSLNGTPVVAKLLIDDDLFWQKKFTAEIDTYRAFASAPPPVPTPRLLAGDPHAGVLVVTRLPGRPISDERYPAALKPDAVQVMLSAAEALQGWSAPAGLYATVWDYPHRFHRYRTDFGLLDARDEAALNALAHAAGPLRLAHGDLLASNVLQAGDTRPAGLCGVLDWEFTGWFLPGLDAALLWLVLGQIPGTRDTAEHLAGDSPAQRAGFWTNVATLCLRELRTHGELPAGPLRTHRLAYLQATWVLVQGRVHELATHLSAPQMRTATEPTTGP